MKPALKHSITVFASVLLTLLVSGQEEKALLREGNKAYTSDDMATATEKYQDALSLSPSYGKASYNLGSAMYRLQQLGEAAKHYEVAAADALDKFTKSDAFHNLGNCFLNTAIALQNSPPQPNDSTELPDPQKMIWASIEAYKKALRLDPKDEETRYNLAYAQSLIDNQGGGQGDDQQDQEDKEDQENQDEQEENKDEKGDEGENDDPKDEGDENKDEQNSEPKDDDMSKEEAERLLNALDQQEKDLQEELGKQRMQEGKPIKIEKDW